MMANSQSHAVSQMACTGALDGNLYAIWDLGDSMISEGVNGQLVIMVRYSKERPLTADEVTVNWVNGIYQNKVWRLDGQWLIITAHEVTEVAGELPNTY